LILRIHKEECAVKHTPQTIFVKSFLLVVSLGTQLRCLKGAEIIKPPAWTTTFIPVAGLDTCKWYLMRWNNYPAPSTQVKHLVKHFLKKGKEKAA